MLDLNAIRAEFAGDLSADPLRHGLDRAFAASVERAYRQGLCDAEHGRHELWRPNSEVPSPGTTAIIATLSDDGECWALLPGIYLHTGGDWREECDGAPLDYAEFWWIAESDLTARILAPGLGR